MMGMSFNRLRRGTIGRAGVIAVLAGCALAATPALATASAPTVGSLSPKIGRASGGTVVRISGAGFTGATAVDFGSTPAKSFSVQSSAAIFATTPPGTGFVSVTVTTGEGTSEATAKAQFHYLEPPEFGTCEKLGFGLGSFTASGCAVEQNSPEGNAEYEWFPGFEGTRPIVKHGFTLTAAKGMKLEGTIRRYYGYNQIVCTSGSATGEYSAAKQVEVSAMAFTGCSSRIRGGCTSAGAAPGEVRFEPLTGTLGVTELKSGEKASVGLDLKATTGETLTTFSCSDPVSVRGDLIVGLKTPDKMVEKIKWAASESHGVPKTRFFIGGAEAVLELNFKEAGYERAGLKLSANGLNEEAIDFSTKI
jgi:hypothetical protein